MPQQQQQRNANSGNNDNFAVAMVGLLLFPAQMVAVFTHRRFGVRALGGIGRYFAGTLAFAGFHELGITEAHWNNPSFFQSIAWDFFLVMYAVSVWRLAEAWWAFRKRKFRHTQSFGEPYLMLLGIPYRLAVLLDGAMIFALGSFMRRYDVALGAWLMYGACGLWFLMLMGMKLQFKHTADLMDSGYYAERIQDLVERPDTILPTQRFAPAAESDEVSTAAQGRPK